MHARPHVDRWTRDKHMHEAVELLECEPSSGMVSFGRFSLALWGASSCFHGFGVRERRKQQETTESNYAKILVLKNLC